MTAGAFVGGFVATGSCVVVVVAVVGGLVVAGGASEVLALVTDDDDADDDPNIEFRSGAFVVRASGVQVSGQLDKPPLGPGTEKVHWWSPFPLATSIGSSPSSCTCKISHFDSSCHLPPSIVT